MLSLRCSHSLDCRCDLISAYACRLLNEAASCRHPVRQSRLPYLRQQTPPRLANNNHHPTSTSQPARSLLHSLYPPPTLVHHPPKIPFSAPGSPSDCSLLLHPPHIFSLSHPHARSLNMHSRFVATGLLAAICGAHGMSIKYFSHQPRITDQLRSRHFP